MATACSATSGCNKPGVLRGALPQPSCDSFMSARPRADLLRVALDSELTNTAAREQAVVHGVDVELYSTVAGADPPGQVRVPAWSDLPVGVGVSRSAVRRDPRRALPGGLALDPVPLPQGTRLPCDTHRLAGPGTARHGTARHGTRTPHPRLPVGQRPALIGDAGALPPSAHPIWSCPA
ncbi:hypothetical protein ACIQOU_03530 [Streptomyces sp. NPDC091279]|uniref:hypothetical protein n=1 Tax=Streptomyces sp. NPDC091279 TaxID=3365983 RepID=UPI003815D67A